MWVPEDFQARNDSPERLEANALQRMLWGSDRHAPDPVGIGTDESKADDIAAHLLELATKDEALQAEALLRLRDERAGLLEARSLRMLATSLFVAERLSNTTDLDWSAAVMESARHSNSNSLCGLVEPLADRCSGEDLSSDFVDRDLGRARCIAPGRPPRPRRSGRFVIL